MIKRLAFLVIFLQACSAQPENIALDIYETTVKSKNHANWQKEWFETYYALKANNCGAALSSLNEDNLSKADKFWKSHMLETGTCLQQDQKAAFEIFETEAITGNYVSQLRYAYYLDIDLIRDTPTHQVQEAYYQGLALMPPFRQVQYKTEFLTQNRNYVFSGNPPSANYLNATNELQKDIDIGYVGYLNIAKKLLNGPDNFLHSALRWLDKIPENQSAEANFLYIETLLSLTDTNNRANYLKHEAIERLYRIDKEQLSSVQIRKIEEWQKKFMPSSIAN